jgi:hypothetical protein
MGKSVTEQGRCGRSRRTNWRKPLIASPSSLDTRGIARQYSGHATFLSDF